MLNFINSVMSCTSFLCVISFSKFNNLNTQCYLVCLVLPFFMLGCVTCWHQGQRLYLALIDLCNWPRERVVWKRISGRVTNDMSRFWAPSMPAQRCVEENGSDSILAIRCHQVSHQKWISGDVQHICLCQVRIRMPIPALKPGGDVTISPKHEYQWPHKKRTYVLKNFFSHINILKSIEFQDKHVCT